MNVITVGRTDIDAYFEKSGIRWAKRLNDTPFLVFIESPDTVTVKIVDSVTKLLGYPDDTKVMGQWRGQWNSDFFQFKVRELREYIVEHPS